MNLNQHFSRYQTGLISCYSITKQQTQSYKRVHLHFKHLVVGKLFHLCYQILCVGLNRGKVLEALMQQRELGAIPGIFGRLVSLKPYMHPMTIASVHIYKLYTPPSVVSIHNYV